MKSQDSECQEELPASETPKREVPNYCAELLGRKHLNRRPWRWKYQFIQERIASNVSIPYFSWSCKSRSKVRYLHRRFFLGPHDERWSYLGCGLMLRLSRWQHGQAEWVDATFLFPGSTETCCHQYDREVTLKRPLQTARHCLKQSFRKPHGAMSIVKNNARQISKRSPITLLRITKWHTKKCIDQ